nr:Ig-like domain-containing protein [Lachnospiraceae bacterium]
TLAKKGKTYVVKATATPSKASTGESIKVSTSNKKVATAKVNQTTGKITVKATGKGFCKITVKAGKKKVTLKVKVSS